MLERRRYLRFKDEAVLILKTGEDPSRTMTTSVADISILGLGVFAQEPILPGTSVTYELTTKLWHTPLTGDGKVIYAIETPRQGMTLYRMGIDFVTVDKAAIQGIINRVQKDLCEKSKEREQARKIAR